MSLRRLVFGLVVAGVFVFLLGPVVFVVLASFDESTFLTFPPSRFTLDWYRGLSAAFLASLKTSLIVAAATAVISTLVGVPAALGLVRGHFRGRQVLNTAMLSPLVVPTLVIGVAAFQFYIWVWDVSGVGLGGSVMGLVIGHTAFAVAYVIRSVVASLAHFDVSLEEAAMNLGATPPQSFFRVTLPQIMPGVTAGAIFAFITSFDDVPVALFLSGADATTLPIKIFTSIEFSLTPEVMAVSALVVLGSTAVMILLDRILGLDTFFGVPRA